MEVQGAGGAATVAGGVTDRGLKSLKSEDFFRILVTELQQQDPLEPSKSEDMISNVANIRNIELSSQLSTSLASLADTQQRTGVSDMIGKLVSATVDLGDGNATPVEGVVTGVRFGVDGQAVLELDTGVAVPANAVERVSSVSAGGPEVLLAQADAGGAEDGDDGGAKADTVARRLSAFGLPHLRRV